MKTLGIAKSPPAGTSAFYVIEVVGACAYKLLLPETNDGAL